MKFDDIDCHTESYIQKSAKLYWYKRLFEHFHQAGFSNIGSCWSWWAFFFGPEYLLYRKCYVEALFLYIGRGCIMALFPPAIVFIPFVNAFLAPFLIYRRFEHLVDMSYRRAPKNEGARMSIVQHYGGYNTWVVVVVIVCCILVSVFIGMIITLLVLGVAGFRPTELLELLELEIPNFRIWGQLPKLMKSI